MSFSKQYAIADITIAFCSNEILQDSPAWQLFAAPPNVPSDFTYFCQLYDHFPEFPEKPEVRRYFDSVKGRYYAITEDMGSRIEISLSKENLPWGTSIDQLYSQLALTHILLQKSKMLLHASYILTEQGAILFTAPSGTGKSTQAELWRKHRSAIIVNGDRAVVGLRGRAPTAYGFPLSGSSEDCLNITSKLRAIVRLKQAPNNSVRLLQGAECVSVLINGTGIPEEYPEDACLTMETAIELARTIPVLELSCLPDESAVCALENALKRLENGETV